MSLIMAGKCCSYGSRWCRTGAPGRGLNLIPLLVLTNSLIPARSLISSSCPSKRKKRKNFSVRSFLFAPHLCIVQQVWRVLLNQSDKSLSDSRSVMMQLSGGVLQSSRQRDILPPRICARRSSGIAGLRTVSDTAGEPSNMSRIYMRPPVRPSPPQLL